MIVPATDSPTTLDRCRRAILAATDPPDQVIVIERPLNSGPAAARNAGAEQATGSILIFVDSDVVVHPDAFGRIKAAFAGDPELVAVFGGYDYLPSAHGTVSTFRNLLHHYVHQHSPGAATTFWAGLGAVRRDAFLAAGGFDARRFPSPSVEDIELGLRLAASGAKIVLDPAIQGTHLKRWRLLDMLVTDLVHRGAPWMELLLDRGAHAARLNLGGRHGLAATAFVGGCGAAASRRFRLTTALATAFLALNARFYALLFRRAGLPAGVAGVGLHLLHTATALAAAPLGALTFLLRARGLPRSLPPLATSEREEQGNGRRFRRPHAGDTQPVT